MPFIPGTLLESIRSNKPLIHHITNMVVMNDTANITLAIGALPVMAPALEEVEEMVRLASALVLNIGTLTPNQINSMLRAGKEANKQGIPIVLDPVGAGATSLRTEAAKQLLAELNIDVLRGNAAEIASLVGVVAETRGVESMAITGERDELVIQAARILNTTVAMTGAQDLVSDGHTLIAIDNGHPLLASITGSGCMSTSLVGAFLAVTDNTIAAATGALVAMGIAGEIAAPKSGGPGTFRSHLLDAVAALDVDTLESRQKVSKR